MNEIIVIGANPPCPRCSLLTNVIMEKVKELGISVNILHLSYSDEETHKFAEKIGFKTGDGKRCCE